MPIKNTTGDVIGAIGVSGSSVENDHCVAEAGHKQFKCLHINIKEDNCVSILFFEKNKTIEKLS
jgi:uncharacterized protein (UPF0303 family)